MSPDNDMCILGLNDVIYVVPEYTPEEYEDVYRNSCNGNEREDFKGFFEHFSDFTYNPQKENIPNRMVGLYKNMMSAIEKDHYEPYLRGRSFINLKNFPNGHYTVYCVRIGQPISIKSRLKILGKAKGIYINFNREKISLNRKPQLDLGHSSSRIRKGETNKFKIIKAKQSKQRDNKVVNLNSEQDDESEDEVEPILKELEDSIMNKTLDASMTQASKGLDESLN